MIVRIQSPGPLDVIEFSTEKDGTVTAKPYFFGGGKEGTAAAVFVYEEGDTEGETGPLLFAAKLVVNGATGKLALIDRSRPVPAAREAAKQAPDEAKIDSKCEPRP